jgi:hypothetical protein
MSSIYAKNLRVYTKGEDTKDLYLEWEPYDSRTYTSWVLRSRKNGGSWSNSNSFTREVDSSRYQHTINGYDKNESYEFMIRGSNESVYSNTVTMRTTTPMYVKISLKSSVYNQPSNTFTLTFTGTVESVSSFPVTELCLWKGTSQGNMEEMGSTTYTRTTLTTDSSGIATCDVTISGVVNGNKDYYIMLKAKNSKSERETGLEIYNMREFGYFDDLYQQKIYPNDLNYNIVMQYDTTENPGTPEIYLGGYVSQEIYCNWSAVDSGMYEAEINSVDQVIYEGYVYETSKGSTSSDYVGEVTALFYIFNQCPAGTFLKNGTDYTVYIIARNSAGKKSESSEHLSQTPCVVPGPCTEFTCTPSTNDDQTIKCTWKRPTADIEGDTAGMVVTSYSLEIRSASSTSDADYVPIYQPIENVEETTYEYLVLNQDLGSYDLRLAAYNGAGRGESSVVSDVAVAIPPGELSIYSGGYVSHKIFCNWYNVYSGTVEPSSVDNGSTADGLKEYRGYIYESSKTGPNYELDYVGSVYDTKDLNATGYIFTVYNTSSGTATLQDGTEYTVYMKVVNSEGLSSDISNTASQTPCTEPDPPVLDAVKSGEQSLTFTFKRPSDGGNAIIKYTLKAALNGVVKKKTS